MKKKVRSTILAILALGMLLSSISIVQASTIEPRYTGLINLKGSLTISAQGKATCDGTVYLESGYTVDLKVELTRDGTTIKTWLNSGSGTVSAGGIYYVTPGHTYVVTATATVYNANGRVVETQSHSSQERSY